MKFATLFLFALLALATPIHGTFSKSEERKILKLVRLTPLGKSKKALAVLEKAFGIVQENSKKCKPRICFAIDGSSSINKKEFALQKNLVLLTAAALGPLKRSKFAAVQYGVVIDEIIKLGGIASRKGAFLKHVTEAEQTRSSKTFIAPGLQYCAIQMKKDGGAIILLGDGRSNFGDATGAFGAVDVSKKFLSKRGNSVVIAVVGKKVSRLFKDIVGGDKSKIVTARKWDDIIKLSSVERILKAVCS